jgi:anti-sigma B factor antagonist
VLTLDVHQRTDCLLLCAEGELDVETTAAFRQRLSNLLSHESLPVVVDLSGLQFVDSSGLGALVVTLRLPETIRPRIVVEPTNGRIGRLLRTTRMDRLLPVYPSVEAAFAATAIRSAA